MTHRLLRVSPTMMSLSALCIVMTASSSAGSSRSSGPYMLKPDFR